MHYLALGVYPRAPAVEDLQGLLGLHEYTRLLEHLQSGQVDLTELILGEDTEAETPAVYFPGMQRTFQILPLQTKRGN